MRRDRSQKAEERVESEPSDTTCSAICAESREEKRGLSGLCRWGDGWGGGRLLTDEDRHDRSAKDEQVGCLVVQIEHQEELAPEGSEKTVEIQEKAVEGSGRPRKGSVLDSYTIPTAMDWIEM